RKNIPTAEFQSVVQREHQQQMQVTYARTPDAPQETRGAPAGPLQAERNARNRDLDPQLVWRGKDQQDWSDLVVNAPPLYIQEKVHPKVLIDDLKRQTDKAKAATEPEQQGFTADLFADMAKDFNGLPDDDAKTEFYAHDQHWSNRMILGDSLQVMASLAEREGLRGKVQCIYFDPPYGIKFNSNFQWSTTNRDVKDGNADHITREPEMVKAFRDTWKDGIHSYLAYIRDRLTVARDLLTESGSIFVQIGDENVHRVRAVMDEVFGPDNFFAQISFVKAGALGATGLPRQLDYIVWFAKNVESIKYRKALLHKSIDDLGQYTQVVKSDYSLRPLTSSEKNDPKLIPIEKLCRLVSFTKPGPGARYPLRFEGKEYLPGTRWWGFPEPSTEQIKKAGRFRRQGNSIASLRYWKDYAAEEISNIWTDTASGSGMDKVYVVQTNEKVIQRCMLMTTDPGDLVLDPTCGSGTTAFTAEQWGRRWITIDTSRVALALARARIMGARYPFYLLADSKEGQVKEGEVTRTAPKSHATHGNIRQGFVYERVPHITLKSIANNAEIDVIYDKHQALLEPLREQLNAALKTQWQEWEIPREADDKWGDAAKNLHADWWKQRIARQQEIDASIAAKADFEYLYDRPYEDKKKVRVAGPFTVESLLPHRVLGVDEDENLIDPAAQEQGGSYERNFAQIILDNLRTAGVQQAHKIDKINFTSLTPWPGEYVCAEGRYMEGADAEGNGGTEKRAGIFIGPEFGTVSRPDLVTAAREAGDAGFDVLIACAFNYDAHSSDFSKLG
ncbi:MAG: site-specific DNA-methyltransferase, partial [Betaproteobacteria bacterium]